MAACCAATSRASAALLLRQRLLLHPSSSSCVSSCWGSGSTPYVLPHRRFLVTSPITTTAPFGAAGTTSTIQTNNSNYTVCASSSSSSMSTALRLGGDCARTCSSSMMILNNKCGVMMQYIRSVSTQRKKQKQQQKQQQPYDFNDNDLDNDNDGLFRLPPNIKIMDPDSFLAPRRILKSNPSPTHTKKKHQQTSSSSSTDPSMQQQVDVHEETHDDDNDNDDDDDESYDDGNDHDDDVLYLPQPEIRYAIPLPDRLHVPVYSIFMPKPTAQVGTVWLHSRVFGRDPIRIDLLQRNVEYERATKRGRRKARTKRIGEVSGSGKKRRPQKGTGHARVGHSRPPHFRGGAKAHGPTNQTDYGNTKLNAKVRKQALQHALSQKLKEGNLIIVNQLYSLPTHKTSSLQRLLEPWNIGGKSGTKALVLDYYRPDQAADSSEASKSTSSSSSTAKGELLKPPPSSSSSSLTTITDHYQKGTMSATPYRAMPVNFFVASRNLSHLTAANVHAANVYNILKHETLVLTLDAVMALEARLKDY